MRWKDIWSSGRVHCIFQSHKKFWIFLIKITQTQNKLPPVNRKNKKLTWWQILRCFPFCCRKTVFKMKTIKYKIGKMLQSNPSILSFLSSKKLFVFFFTCSNNHFSLIFQNIFFSSKNFLFFFLKLFSQSRKQMYKNHKFIPKISFQKNYILSNFFID